MNLKQTIFMVSPVQSSSVPLSPMFENTYFTVFKIKKRVFYVFLQWHFKKRRKRYQSVATAGRGSLSATSSVADLRANRDAAVDKFSVSISSFLLDVKMGSWERPLQDAPGWRLIVW